MSDLLYNSSLFGNVGAIPYPLSDNATESLEFFTGVLPSSTNEAEERSNLRALPRNYLNYKYKLPFKYQQEVYTVLRSNLRGLWLIPLWFECQQATVTMTATTINVDTLLHDLRDNSHALLFKSICDWQIVTIETTTDTTIEIAEGGELNGSIFVIPFRLGKLQADAGGNITGYSSEFNLSFYVNDVLAGLTESVTQLEGKDFYTIPYLKENKTSVQIIQAEETNDFSVGGIDSETPWAWSMYSRDYKFDGQGIANYRAFKNYFYRRAGKYREFFSPTFESNLLNASTGTVTTTFTFMDNGYVNNLFAHIKRLGFLLTNGIWLVRTVTAAVNIADGKSEATLNTSLAVPASSIAMVSFVTLNRLDTDRAEIALRQNGYFTSSASVVEISE